VQVSIDLAEINFRAYDLKLWLTFLTRDPTLIAHIYLEVV